HRRAADADAERDGDQRECDGERESERGERQRAELTDEVGIDDAVRADRDEADEHRRRELPQVSPDRALDEPGARRPSASGLNAAHRRGASRGQPAMRSSYLKLRQAGIGALSSPRLRKRDRATAPNVASRKTSSVSSMMPGRLISPRPSTMKQLSARPSLASLTACRG